MPYIVYILKSKKDGKRYIGFTEDLERRLFEHKSGLVISTKYRRLLTLIYHEEFETKSEAMAREKYFKTGFGRKYLQEKGF
jgi:putative endonuclease